MKYPLQSILFPGKPAKVFILIFFFFLGFAGGAEKVLAQVLTNTPTPCSCASAQVTYGTGFGSGNGQMNGADQMAVGTTGGIQYVFIADINNQRVAQFNAVTGAWVANLTGVGPGNPSGGLDTPYGVALSSDGHYLFVAATNGGCVVKLDLTNGGQPVTAFAMNHPVALTVDSNGDVYATDVFTVRKFRETSPNQYSQMATLGAAGVTGSGNSQFNQPFGILVQGNYVYVSDSFNTRIVRWTTSDGVNYNYDATVFSSAVQPSQLTLDPGTSHVYAASLNGGWQVFDLSTTPWSPLYQCYPGSQTRVDGVAADSSSVFFSFIMIDQGAKYPKPSPACFAPVTLATDTPTPNPTFVYHGSNPPGQGECFIFPSPVRGDHATVSYDMAEPGKVDLKIWNAKAGLAGHFTDQKPLGVQITPFSASGLPTGVYFYDLTLTYDSGRVEKLPLKKFVIIH